MAVYNKIPVRRAVWAVDIFDGMQPLFQIAVDIVRWLSAQGVEIQPVYLFSPSQANLYMEYPGGWLEESLSVAQQAIQEKFSHLGIPGLPPPKILVQHFMSVTGAVDDLSTFAADVSADLIITSSHGRTGLKRLLHGSFAETLLTHARLPILVLGPEVHQVGELSQVIFPTEFGPDSKWMFRKAVEVAGGLGSELTLFHAIPHPIEPVFQSGVYLIGGSWVPIQNYVTRQLQHQQRRAHAWAEWATYHGVKTQAWVDTDARSVVDSILRAARDRKVGLIFMEAQSGPLSASLVGSVTRQIVRRSSCPVWVIPSRAIPAEGIRPQPEKLDEDLTAA